MLQWVVSQVCTMVRASRSERGASLVEYGLLVALVALVCVAAVAFFGTTTSSTFSSTTTSLFP